MRTKAKALPEAPDASWPRYTAKAFPPYRFVPARTPHPQRDPDGHAFGQAAEHPAPVSVESWRENRVYLYGIDLYNYAYWWECHEALEGLWLAEGRRTEQAKFLQGLIQVSAANLQRFMGGAGAADRLLRDGLGRLDSVHGGRGCHGHSDALLPARRRRVHDHE